jgi:hypothetical protein
MERNCGNKVAPPLTLLGTGGFMDIIELLIRKDRE